MSRSIFEEVGADAPKGGAQPPRSGEETRSAGRRNVRIWILALAVLVTLQILIGGLTRITDSGLSITTWSLVGHTVPPLSDAEWAKEFDLYKTTTEFQEQNSDMTVDEFKSIYWWEWFHRFWGQLIGLAFLIPFVIFLAKRAIPSGFLPVIAAAGALGALQDGRWHGLVARPDRGVSGQLPTQVRQPVLESSEALVEGGPVFSRGRVQGGFHGAQAVGSLVQDLLAGQDRAQKCRGTLLEVE